MKNFNTFSRAFDWQETKEWFISYLIAGLIFFGAMFLFTNDVFAYSDFNDDFESYATSSTICAQNSKFKYVTGCGSVVNDGNCQGGQCLNVPSGNTMYYRPLAVTDGSEGMEEFISYDVKFTAGSPELRMGIYDGAYSTYNPRCYVTATNDYTCRVATSSTGSLEYTVIDTNFDPNVWHTIYFRFIPSTGFFKIKTDLNDWTQWYYLPTHIPQYSNYHYWSDSSGDIYIDNMRSASTQLYQNGIKRK